MSNFVRLCTDCRKANWFLERCPVRQHITRDSVGNDCFAPVDGMEHAYCAPSTGSPKPAPKPIGDFLHNEEDTREPQSYDLFGRPLGGNHGQTYPGTTTGRWPGNNKNSP